MGAQRRIVDVVARRWRTLRGISEMEVDGQFPLVLTLTDGFRPSGQEVQELNAGRIPERCLDTLGEAATRLAPGTRLAWVFVLLLAFGAVVNIRVGPPNGEPFRI